jgi:hypothetical protein
MVIGRSIAMRVVVITRLTLAVAVTAVLAMVIGRSIAVMIT